MVIYTQLVSLKIPKRKSEVTNRIIMTDSTMVKKGTRQTKIYKHKIFSQSKQTYASLITTTNQYPLISETGMKGVLDMFKLNCKERYRFNQRCHLSWVDFYE